MRFTKETAKEMGRRGGKARARNRLSGSPEERAQTLITASVDAVAEQLLDAAFGRNDFEGLDPSNRVKALFRVADYTLGKPSANPKRADDAPPPGEAPGEGLSFGVADE